MSEAYGHCDVDQERRAHCTSRQFWIATVLLGARTCDLPEDTTILLRCSLVEGLDAERFGKADISNRSVETSIDYNGVQLVFDKIEAVKPAFETKDELLKQMLDCDELCGPLHLQLLDEWVRSALLHSLTPVERIVIRRLSFRWAEGPDLAHLIVTGIHERTTEAGIINIGRNDKDNSKKRNAKEEEGDDDELDWIGLGKKARTKTRAKAKSKPKPKSRPKPKSTSKPESVEMLAILAQDNMDLSGDESLHTEEEEPANWDDKQVEPEDAMLASLIELTVDKGKGKEVLKNPSEAGCGDEERPYADDNGTAVPEIKAEDIAPAVSSALAEITRVPASSTTFLRNPDSIKEQIYNEPGAGMYFLKANADMPELRHLLTVRCVSPVTIKLSCEIHKPKCRFMATSSCWDQIDKEILELAALAGAYSELDNSGIAHHTNSCREAELRVQKLTKDSEIEDQSLKKRKEHKEKRGRKKMIR